MYVCMDRIGCTSLGMDGADRTAGLLAGWAKIGIFGNVHVLVLHTYRGLPEWNAMMRLTL